MVLDTLTELMDTLVDTHPDDLVDAESMVCLFREFSRLDFVLTRASAQFETFGDWAADGAQTAAAWLTTRCHVAGIEAKGRVHLGRKLRDLPATEAAWEKGELTANHVRQLAKARTEVTQEDFARDEEMLVQEAKTLRFEHLVRVLTYWGQLADPDGTEEAAERRRCARAVHLNESFNGTWLGQINLDPVSGTIVAEELARIEREFFDAEWKAAKARLGKEPTTADLERTPGQRRADALVEMAIRSKACPDGTRRPGPLFTVIVDYQSLIGRICELAQGSAVSPGSLVPWLDEAIIERAVFYPDNRVEVGQKSRLFTGATRRAIEVRDRYCTHEYCDKPAQACEIDHVTTYATGGETTQVNGRVLCGYHNRLRNQRPPPDR